MFVGTVFVHGSSVQIEILRVMVARGGEQELADEEELIGDRSTSSISLSCFVNGLLTLVAQLLNGQSISFGRLIPLPLNHFSDLHFSNSS